MSDVLSEILFILGIILLVVGTLATIIAFIGQVVIITQVESGREITAQWTNYCYLGIFPQAIGIWLIGISQGNRD